MKILFVANVTIAESSSIPLATIQRQEFQLITDPKKKTLMPWESSSEISGGKVFFVKWGNNDHDKTKAIRNLPIDQNFKTLARIYGRVGESEQFITHDCPLDNTNTKKWQCLVNTNKYIESIQVCDGKNDCTEEGVDWSDESDEAPERCKGANNKMIAISKFVNITCLVIGYIFSVAYFPMGASKKMWRAVRTDTKSTNNDTIPGDLEPEIFKSLLNVCNQFQEWSNKNVGKAPAGPDLIDITSKYKSILEKRDFKQIQAIYSCLQGFAMSYSFKYTSMIIAEHLIRIENDDLYSVDSSHKGNQSVEQGISVNLRVTKFVIESKEMNDFLSRTKRFIATHLNMRTYSSTMMLATLISTVAVYIVDTIMPYYDYHLDASLAIALHHIETFFITSESKQEEISFISLTITKYYYYFISILSTILLSILMGSYDKNMSD